MKKSLFLMASMFFCVFSVFAQAKGDPWIKKVYNDTYRREPTAFEYNIKNYNNGKWNNYGELQKYIGEYQSSLSAGGLTLKISDKTFANNTKVVGFFQNGNQIAVNLISQDGGNIVASGGGNLIASGGGNLVASGGGNLVASGGGNIAVTPSMKGASLGGLYSIAAEGATIIKTSGSGALIIK